MIDIRNFGLIGAIELAHARTLSGSAFDVFTSAPRQYLLIRTTVTSCVIAALDFAKTQLIEIFNRLADAIQETA